MGTTWAPRTDFTYPTTDTGTGAEGSALFRDPEGLEHAVRDLRARALAAQSS